MRRPRGPRGVRAPQPASKNFLPQMNADERGCRLVRKCQPTRQPPAPRFLSAFICVHPRQNCLAFGDNAAGLPRRHRQRTPQGAPTPAPTAHFKPFRTDPLNREPAAKPAPTVPFKRSGTDPLNREPAAKPASTAPFKPSRTDPLNREPGAEPPPPGWRIPQLPPDRRCRVGLGRGLRQNPEPPQ
jgi:hypothetical protein